MVIALIHCVSIASAETDTTSLYVESDIPETEVYLNGIYQGLTPLTIEPVEPGLWQLILKKNGYYKEYYTIRIIKNEQNQISANLKPITGILTIKNAPPNAEFEIDNVTYTANAIQLTEGIHSVIIRAFGYTQKKTDVSISRRNEKVLDGVLEKAAFMINDLHPLKAAFNPENPANLGQTEIAFRVTAPGTGTIEISDANGKTVSSYTAGPFTTWKQTLQWNGTDTTGASVPDGEYTITVKAKSAAVPADSTAPSAEKEIQAKVKIDRTIIYPFSDSFSGIGAAGPVISGSLMPKGSAMINFDVLSLSGMFCPGLSAVIGFSDFLEGGFRTAVLLDKDSNKSIDIAAGLKAGMQSGNLHSALSLRYSASTNTAPSSAPVSRKGIAFGPAVEYRIAHFAIGADAEVSFGNDEGLFNQPFVTTASGLTLRYISGPFSGAVWGQLEIGHGLVTGVSAQYLIPTTNLVLSGQTGYQISNTYTDSFFFRGGFGILF